MGILLHYGEETFFIQTFLLMKAMDFANFSDDFMQRMFTEHCSGASAVVHICIKQRNPDPVLQEEQHCPPSLIEFDNKCHW